MDYVKFGKAGLGVSRLCIGCMTYGIPGRGPHPWTLDDEKGRPLIKKALDLGINFFDTANVYSVGTQRGDRRPRAEGLRTSRRRRDRDQGAWADAAGAERRGAVPQGHPAEIDNSLRRLGTDYVDLYQIHRFDPSTPIEETHRSAARCRESRQSPLHRRVVHVCLAVLERSYLAAAGWARVRVDAELLQSALPRGGTRNAPAVPRCRASVSFRGARWRAAG